MALAVKEFISSNRYLNNNRKKLQFFGKCSAFTLECSLPTKDADIKKGLSRVASLISKYKRVFNQSKHPQKSLEVQLAVVLYRFSYFGNGASEGVVTRKFGVSEGAADYYVNRVIAALMDLLGAAIKWPAMEEKSKLKGASLWNMARTVQDMSTEP